MELLKTVAFDPNGILVSFDVKSLFTKVPVDEALEIKSRLEQDEILEDWTTVTVADICGLTVVLDDHLFHLQGSEQLQATAVGSPISPVVANIYMSSLNNSQLHLPLWNPICGKGMWMKLLSFGGTVTSLHHLNSLRPSIQFTKEKEDSNGLAFLDVEKDRRQTSVYSNQPTQNSYFFYMSHHHPRVK